MLDVSAMICCKYNKIEDVAAKETILSDLQGLIAITQCSIELDVLTSMATPCLTTNARCVLPCDYVS
jgi:hypothetical protein